MSRLFEIVMFCILLAPAVVIAVLMLTLAFAAGLAGVG